MAKARRIRHGASGRTDRNGQSGGKRRLPGGVGRFGWPSSGSRDRREPKMHSHETGRDQTAGNGSSFGEGLGPARNLRPAVMGVVRALGGKAGMRDANRGDPVLFSEVEP